MYLDRVGGGGRELERSKQGHRGGQSGHPSCDRRSKTKHRQKDSVQFRPATQVLNRNWIPKHGPYADLQQEARHLLKNHAEDKPGDSNIQKEAKEIRTGNLS